MSQLPFSLMNRLNQYESAVFKCWMLYLQRISFQIILFTFNFSCLSIKIYVKETNIIGYLLNWLK